jgi:hypothetical protein
MRQRDGRGQRAWRSVGAVSQQIRKAEDVLGLSLLARQEGALLGCRARNLG